MPEQSFENPDVEKVLENLEDHTISTYQSRCRNYQRMQSALENQHDVSKGIVQRLLAVCIKDLKEDMKFAVHTLNVISVIVKKGQERYSLKDIRADLVALYQEISKVDAMYEEISKAIHSSKTYFNVVMGDFNAKLGSRSEHEVRVRRFGCGKRNQRGQRLADFLEERNFAMYSFFEKPPHRKWTWMRPDSFTRNETDFIKHDHNHNEWNFDINLTSSIMAILNLLKSATLINKVQNLQNLCFEVLMTFPDETYRELGSEPKYYLEIIDIFNLYLNQNVPMQVRLMPFNILFKLLQTLPPDKRSSFVKEGLNTWFSKVIPAVVAMVITTNPMVPRMVHVLELLADELVDIEYSQNAPWLNILDSISSQQKFPEVLKKLQDNGNPLWSRLWIVFVRLAKQQITANRPKTGSPINSMLPVVEQAFKSDSGNRLRAFQCWDILIDNFAAESTDSIKRIKLLLIPLKSNNAKVEETAVAKFHTWWKLIRKFYSRSDKMFESIVLPFLHFCFGNVNSSSEKNALTPGLCYAKLTVMCAQAFAEICGHINCQGCVPDLPPLQQGMLTSSHLTKHFSEWLFTLKVFLKEMALQSCEYETKKDHIQCVWSSFILVSADLSQEQRSRMIGELLNILRELVQETKDHGLTEIAFSLCLRNLLEYQHVKRELYTEADVGGQTSHLHKVLRFTLHPQVQMLYNRFDDATLEQLKLITNIITDKSLCSPNDIIEWILMELTPNDPSLVFWTALLKAVVTLSDVSVENLMDIVLWPLKHLGEFCNTQYSANVWNESYNKLKPKLSASIQKEISVILLTDRRTTIDNFSLYALLHTIKDVLNSNNSTDCKLEAELLVNLLSKAKSPGHIEAGFPLITDCLELMFAKAAESKSEGFAGYTVNASSKTLKLLIQSMKEGGDLENTVVIIERIIKSMEAFFKVDAFMKFKAVVVDQLIELLKFDDVTKCMKTPVCDILKLFLQKSKSTEMPFYSIVNNAIVSMDTNGNKNNLQTAKPDTGFTTPSNKIVTKKSKKKEANVVDTVVDNGEQFEVIKSHWKFNPRKLTEKQKERLQRKREDIPALYQDLSQSQDEFKMNTWKTDSQDTSTSNSKSESTTNAADATSALQKMASSDVVPEIMKNFLSNSPKPANDQVNKPVIVTPKPKVVKPVTPKPKNSPRMALKDRVSQNLKILTEKNATPEPKAPKKLKQTVSDMNLIKTPNAKAENPITAAFSEPAKSDGPRPARAKRRPRKYSIDFIETPTKRRCGKRYPSNSQNEENIMIDDYQDEATDKIHKDLKQNPISIEIQHVDEPQAENVKEILNRDIRAVIDVMKQEIDSREIIVIDDKEESEKGVPDNLMETEIQVIPQTDSQVIQEPDSQAIRENDNQDRKPDNQVSQEANSQVIPETLDTQDIVPVKDKSSPKEDTQSVPDPSTPSNNKIAKEAIKTSTKKSGTKSRLVNALVIDTVEGNPFFKFSEKRPKRKAVSRQRNLTEKTNDKIDNKLEVQTPKKAISDEPKTKHFENDLKKLSESFSNDDMMLSEDFIESSQDSTLTTISVRSTKSSTKKAAKSVKRDDFVPPKDNSQSLLDDTVDRFSRENIDSKEDIEFSRNKSVNQTNVNQTVEIKDTPELDTEPIDKSACFSDVIIINDDPEPITADETISPESQEIATADTQPVTPNRIPNEDEPTSGSTTELNDVAETQLEITDIETAIDTTVSNTTEQSSPFKDQDQRNKDFLNDTLEISPIKTMSPVPETSSINESSEDYEVIVLSSPVQTNGEPFEKSSSPEIFTEDKVSPDKRDLSPPRDIAITTTTPTASPNSLSLKKNRPQMRAGNRAAQMLGLCAPDRLQTILNNCDRAEEEKPTKSNVVTTPARRNLRIQYLSGENNEVPEVSEGSDENENSENFLMFKRILPSANSSPTGPILKRKLAEIADETTLSPASKRKRVSFHDPPVSTTVAVQKYIEPLGVRSPQNISKKITRQQAANMKSPKKLENMFKLDTVLTRAIESFGEITTVCDDTVSSLEPTLSVEVVRNEELNNTDPICPELIACQDSIAVLASELSSPAMKTLFVKELVGKVETVGDLAKLTELEVNRLCIRAPKVVIARKVLKEYADKKRNESQEIGHIEQLVSADVHCSALEKSDMEIQTESVMYSDVEMQTTEVSLASADTQTMAVSLASASVQTDESGSYSTKDLRSCLEERGDFVAELNQCLNTTEKATIAQELSFQQLANLMTSKLTTGTTSESVRSVKDFINNPFKSKDFVLLCSELLKNIHDNTT